MLQFIQSKTKIDFRKDNSFQDSNLLKMINSILFSYFEKKTMKIFYSLLLLVVLFGACSPEHMLNKRLNGKWDLVSIDGQNTDTSFVQTMEFEKDGRKGLVYVNTTKNDTLTSKIGIYSLFKNNTISIAFSNDPTYDTEIFDVESYSKTKLVLIREDNLKHYVFEKK